MGSPRGHFGTSWALAIAHERPSSAHDAHKLWPTRRIAPKVPFGGPETQYLRVSRARQRPSIHSQTVNQMGGFAHVMRDFARVMLSARAVNAPSARNAWAKRTVFVSRAGAQGVRIASTSPGPRHRRPFESASSGPSGDPCRLVRSSVRPCSSSLPSDVEGPVAGPFPLAGGRASKPLPLP
jgi:hypothetical protein